jgi:tRNA G26 N,N-dimethylase Trm1
LDRVIANDFSADAVKAIRMNVEHNEINCETQVIPTHADASLLYGGSAFVCRS